MRPAMKFEVSHDGGKTWEPKGWQPIETAPIKPDPDTWRAPNVLVWAAGYEPRTATWENDRWCASANGGPVWGSDEGGFLGLDMEPTHWRPMPAGAGA